MCGVTFSSDLKKCTGDWFYDQRVNRFSTTPGHDIVRASLKKRSPCESRKLMWALLCSVGNLKTLTSGTE